MEEQAAGHSGLMRVVSPARQELEEVDVLDQSFAQTRPADMPIHEPSEKFIIDFLREKDPRMDHSHLWSLVKFETRGEIFSRESSSAVPNHATI